MLRGSLKPPAEGSRTNVAFVYEGTEYGGVEEYILNLISGLDAQAIQSFVAIAGYNFHSCPDRFLTALRNRGIRILVPDHPPGSRIGSFVNDVRGLTELFRQNAIDVVHIQSSNPDGGRRAILAARLAGIRAIVKTEHLPPSVNAGALTRWVVKPFDALTDVIITDAESSRAEQIALLGRPPGKVRRVYCGIDLGRFDPNHDVSLAKARLGLDPSLPVIGAIGRLTEQKGHTYFVEAARRIREAKVPAQFILIGNGHLEAPLREQVRKDGLEGCFHFLGYQPQTPPFIEAMDVAVMPSLFEGFSLSVLEFMAMAKPIVVTDHPSFLESVENETSALMVPQRDADALAQAILRLIRDPALARRLANEALHKVRGHFGMNRLLFDIQSLYGELLSRRVHSASHIEAHS